MRRECRSSACYSVLEMGTAEFSLCAMLGLPLVATGPAGTALTALASSVLSAHLALGTSLGSDHVRHFILQLIRWQRCLYCV